MVTQHFFKILTLFIIMIFLGLAGVFLVNRLNKDNIFNSSKPSTVKAQTKVAK